jgi:hypothetical protein
MTDQEIVAQFSAICFALEDANERGTPIDVERARKAWNKFYPDYTRASMRLAKLRRPTAPSY